MTQIELIVLGHKDYPNDLGLSKADELIDKITGPHIKIWHHKIAITSIEAARNAASEVIKKDVGAVILFFGTWSEPPIAMTLALELGHIPLMAFGFPMFSHKGKMETTGSLVGATVIKGSFSRIEKQMHLVTGLPEEADTIAAVLDFISAASAKKQLIRTRIGLIGYSAMGIYPQTFDHLLLRSKIGPEVVHIDNMELLNIAETATKQHIKEYKEKLKAITKIDIGISEETLAKSAKLYYAFRKLTEKYNLDAINVKCQYELSQDYGCIPCVPLSLLANEDYLTGCEGDIPTSVAMIILNYLSNKPSTYGDVLDINRDRIYFSSCGYLPFNMAGGDQEKIIRDIDHPGFNGAICSFVLPPGVYTFCRINELLGNFEVVTGNGSGIKTELRQGRFPALNFKLNGSTEDFIAKMGGQHYALVNDNIISRVEILSHLLNLEFYKIGEQNEQQN